MGRNLVDARPGSQKIGYFAHAQAKLLGVLAAREKKANRLYRTGRGFVARENAAGSEQRVHPAVGEARRRYRVSTRAGGIRCEVFKANNN
jgi:hypothetical protein